MTTMDGWKEEQRNKTKYVYLSKEKQRKKRIDRNDHGMIFLCGKKLYRMGHWGQEKVGYSMEYGI